MVSLLKKYHRLYDYFKIKEPEVYLSVVFTAIILFVLIKINMYCNFIDFSETIQEILMGLVSGMLGLIGIALSGVAIITGLFSKKNVDIIEKRNGCGTFERIMSSFLFLSMSCALYVFYTIILVLIINSNEPVIEPHFFYAICVITVYFAIFNILYTVSLVGNCIRIFAIRNTYEKIKEKDFFDYANEFRIDYILSGITQKCDISQEEFLNDLEKIVNDSKVENKEELINYFYWYYTGKNKQ